MKNIIAALMLLVSLSAIGQSVNDYKYAIVPSEFKFLDGPDQYRMNTFTKMYMEKYGFVTYFDTDILPQEASFSNCNKVYVDIQSSSTMFTTILKVVLKDCTDKVLFTSGEGRSREKDNKIAYPIALREAFSSFDALGYKYNGTVTEVSHSTVRTTNDGTTITSETIQPKSQPSIDVGAQYFAQPIKGGFQIVDNTPKVVMILRNTSANGVYLAEQTTLRGILFSRQDSWVFEYYDNGKLASQILKIKF